MAEIRKHAPDKGGHIAEAVAKAMGESVRPVTPGASPDPSTTSAAESTPVSMTATSFLVSDPFRMPATEEQHVKSGDEERADP